MFTHDPLQTQFSMGAYTGATNPFGSPYQTLQTGINPGTFNPFAGTGQSGGISPFAQQGYSGVPNYGAIAQQQQQLQQLAAILASQGIPQQSVFPQMTPWQNPAQVMAQSPLLAQNPLTAAILAQHVAQQTGSPYGQPQFSWPGYPQTGQIGSPFAQQTGLPYGQIPFAQAGYPLAPQSWVGQPGFGGAQHLQGQLHQHYLSQLAARGLC